MGGEEELGTIRGNWNDLWCVWGDFNVICLPSEQNTGGSVSSTMRRFSKFLDELGFKGIFFRLGCFRSKTSSC